ncbi:hypothetical protein, partial [Neobacillus cucumis]|uniref:hypothetical protein n=1 Tax=Neobacillus cucumis TaxID=1740721 RepID=UPI0019653484
MTQKTRRAVRSQAKFGQHDSENTQSCPKSSQVRTAQARKHEELSEVKPSSVSMTQKTRRAVRSQAKIGQHDSENTKSCPKSSQVRTAQARKHAELSEVKPRSDSMTQKTRRAVRSQAKFRQHDSENTQSCPKSSQVQTA